MKIFNDTEIMESLTGRNIQQEIIESILSGEVLTPQDVATRFNIPLFNATKILNDPTFIQTLSGFSIAKANIHFHTKGVAKILELADSNDPKVSLQAIKLQAQISSNLKGVQSTDVNVNLNLEGLLRREEEKEVKGNVIDLEDYKSSTIQMKSDLEDYLSTPKKEKTINILPEPKHEDSVSIEFDIEKFVA